jgi:heme oxygenase
MLLDDLKSQTRTQHSRLEKINGLPESRADYIALLERFYGFVAPWERRMAEHLPADDVLRSGREKTVWLEADLSHFECGAGHRKALPCCEDLPGTHTRAAILGACYVFEGSTLGGQFIARHLREKLGMDAGEGDRYFSSYGPDVGSKWQAFREELLRHSSPENDPEIVRAAQETFEKLGAWFAMGKGVPA